MRINLTPVTPSCGECTLCCKVMGVQEGDFHKPKDTWCTHARKGRGCGIYELRPTICRQFTCLWLARGGGGLRPDRLHAVLTSTTDGQNYVIHEDPGYEGAARTTLKPEIDAWLKQDPTHYVIVVCGEKRVFYGQKAKWDALVAAGAPEARARGPVHEQTIG